MIKAPENSAAGQYAAQNGIAFESFGEMCSLEKVTRGFDLSEENWIFHRDEQMHYDICEHGARFNYANHTVDPETSECGSECSECGAYFCFNRGFSNIAPSIENATDADCISPSYTGDLMCRCGRLIQVGQYVGEPTYAHVAGSDGWYYDEDNHYKKCGFCGWRLEDSSHCGGLATTTQKAICEICGVEYGEFAEEHIHSATWLRKDEHSHYWECNCGEKLSVEAHYGGEATEEELAVCAVCGMAYGELAEHIHTAMWQGSDEYSHYWVCTCGEAFNFESHSGGVATEDQLALCEVCGVAYGDLAEHIHTAMWQESDEYSHYWVCTCGEAFNYESHSGGVATDTQRAICVVCGAEYGEYAISPETTTETSENGTEKNESNTEATENNTEKNESNTEATENNTEKTETNTESTENNTEKTENDTEVPENSTEPPENNTGSSESNTQVPDNSGDKIDKVGGGCGSTVDIGCIGVVLLATGFMFSKKKHNN